MLLYLPADYQRPGDEQKSIDRKAAAGQFHSALAECGLSSPPPRATDYEPRTLDVGAGAHTPGLELVRVRFGLRLRRRLDLAGDGVLGRERIQKLVQLFFAEGFHRVGVLLFFGGDGGHFGGSADDIRSQKDEQLGVGLVLDGVPEQQPEERDVSQERDFGDGFGFGGFHQATDDDGLAGRGGDDGVGGTGIDEGSADGGGAGRAAGDRNPLRAVLDQFGLFG